MKHCIICGANRCTCGGDIGSAPTRYAPVGSLLTTSNTSGRAVRSPLLEPFVADRNIYLNEQSEVVEEDDDSRLTLLINKGGRLSAEVALFHGLIETTMPDAEIETRDGDSANSSTGN